MLGGEEPVHPVLSAISIAFGALAGCATGFFGFLLATFFPALLRYALPAMTTAWFVVLWTAAIGILIVAYAGVLRDGKGTGTRVYAICGITIVLALFAGDVTGTVSFYPWQTRAYLTPAVEQPLRR